VDRQDTTVTLPWMGAGTEFLGRIVGALPDDAFRAQSALPGWSRAHVVAHLARNAEALSRLANWARTGVETPMYADREQRAAEIESSAQAPVESLRRELVSTADELDAALAALDDTAWRAEVRTALGRAVPAAEVPWMRVREVWLHAIDLDAGAAVADLPSEIVDALLDDVTATLSSRGDCPTVRLVPVDRDRTWPLGPEPDERSVEVRGDAAWVLGWLIGRTAGAGVDAVDAGGGPAALPAAPRWL
jgi:maleylpyruvate isomerase